MDKTRFICLHNNYFPLCRECHTCRHGKFKKSCFYCIGVAVCCKKNPHRITMRERVKKHKTLLEFVK